MSNTALVFSVASVPAIVGLVEAFKRAGLPTRFAPIVAVALGVMAAAVQLAETRWPAAQGIAAGVAMGLSASGLYAGVQTTVAGSSSANKTTAAGPTGDPVGRDRGAVSRRPAKHVTHPAKTDAPGQD